MPLDESEPPELCRLDLIALIFGSLGLFRDAAIQHIVKFIIIFIGSVLSLGIATGPLIAAYLRSIDSQLTGQEFRASSILEDLHPFRSAFLTSWFVLSAVLIGGLFGILPGIFMFVMWSYAIWFVAIDQMQPRQALRSSWQLVATRPLDILRVLAVTGLINIIGALTVIGLLVSGPISLLFMSVAFSELRLLSQDEPID